MDDLNSLVGPRQATRLIAVVIVVAALYWARELLIPLALAILISFLLYPLVARLRRIGLHNGFAVAVVTLGFLVVVGGIGYVISRQALDLTVKLPDYRGNLKSKIRMFRSNGETVAKLSGTIRELKQELASSRPTTQTAAVEKTPEAADAIAVHVVDEDVNVLSMITDFAGPLLAPLTSLAVSFIFLVFLLIGAEELRDRLVWFSGAGQISLTTVVIDDIGQSISGFLRMQLMVNAAYGGLVATALLLIGVPNALLWGLLSGLLRYVPYIGPWIAAAMPTLLSIAVFQGWTKPLVVIAAFVACELLCNLVFEPMLYSSSTGISSWGVVLASFFWGWLWGGVGLIVAVPLTVCLVVVGKRVPQFSFFTKFLGSGDVLSPDGKLYQRLLAFDEVASSELIQRSVTETDRVTTADLLVAPVLQTLKHDLQTSGIGREQAQAVIRGLEDVAEFTNLRENSESPFLLSVAAQDITDDCAARVLAALVEAAGHAAAVATSNALASEAIDMARMRQPTIVAIVQVRPCSLAHTTYLIKSMRKNIEGVHVLAVCLDSQPVAESVKQRFVENGAERVVSSYDEAMRYVAERSKLKPKSEKVEPAIELAHT